MRKLVKIGKTPAPASWAEKIEQAPIADKFFLCGVISGLYGVSYLGIHLLLMLHGAMTPWSSYVQERRFHATIQVFLFFGCFILGFLFQAAPKLFQQNSHVSRFSIALIMPLVTGVLLAHFLPDIFPGNCLISASFLVALLLVAKVIASAGMDVILGMGLPVITALAAFSLGALSNIENPLHALIVTWLGLAGSILAASQQFIQGFLGGRRLAARDGLMVSSLLLVSGCSLCAFVFLQYEAGWSLFAYSAAATLLVFIWQTRLYTAAFKPSRDPIYIGSLFGWSWALIGACFAIQGPHTADAVLHIWATGWGTTLIITLAPRIIGFLGGRAVLRHGRLMLLILVWQLVPLGRGVFTTGPWPAVVAAAAALSFLPWSCIMAWNLLRLLRRQLMLRQGQKMVQC